MQDLHDGAQPCKPQPHDDNLRILTDALQRGGTLIVRHDQSLLDDAKLQTWLKYVFPLSDTDRRLQLRAPTALCIHWLGFCGQRLGINRNYPIPRLQYLIENSFGLPSFIMPEDALLAALAHEQFTTERVKISGGGYGWAANIRSVTRHPQNLSRQVPLGALGQPGIVPPIKIRAIKIDTESIGGAQ
jgi:hypothetical protein